MAGQLVDCRMLEHQLRFELGAEPFLELDDEIGRGRRVETHLRKRDPRADRDRRVDGAPDVIEAPVADLGFARLRRRQHDSPWRWRPAILYHRRADLPSGPAILAIGPVNSYICHGRSGPDRG